MQQSKSLSVTARLSSFSASSVLRRRRVSQICRFLPDDAVAAANGPIPVLSKAQTVLRNVLVAVGDVEDTNRSLQWALGSLVRQGKLPLLALTHQLGNQLPY